MKLLHASIAIGSFVGLANASTISEGFAEEGMPELIFGEQLAYLRSLVSDAKNHLQFFSDLTTLLPGTTTTVPPRTIRKTKRLQAGAGARSEVVSGGLSNVEVLERAFATAFMAADASNIEQKSILDRLEDIDFTVITDGMQAIPIAKIAIEVLASINDRIRSATELLATVEGIEVGKDRKKTLRSRIRKYIAEVGESAATQEQIKIDISQYIRELLTQSAAPYMASVPVADSVDTDIESETTTDDMLLSVETPEPDLIETEAVDESYVVVSESRGPSPAVATSTPSDYEEGASGLADFNETTEAPANVTTPAPGGIVNWFISWR